MTRAAFTFTWDSDTGQGHFGSENMSRDAYVALATLAIEKLRKVDKPTNCACEMCERARVLLAIAPPSFESVKMHDPAEVTH